MQSLPNRDAATSRNPARVAASGMVSHSSVKCDPVGFAEKRQPEFHFLHLIEDDGSQKSIQFLDLRRVRFRSNFPTEGVHEVLTVHSSV